MATDTSIASLYLGLSRPSYDLSVSPSSLYIQAHDDCLYQNPGKMTLGTDYWWLRTSDGNRSGKPRPGNWNQLTP